MSNLIRPIPLRDAILTHLNLPSNKTLRKDRKLFFNMVLEKTKTYEEFNIRSPNAASTDVKAKAKPVPPKYVCLLQMQQWLPSATLAT